MTNAARCRNAIFGVLLRRRWAGEKNRAPPLGVESLQDVQAISANCPPSDAPALHTGDFDVGLARGSPQS